MKNTLFAFSSLLIIFVGICCKQSKNPLPGRNQISDPFFGDPILAKNNYFETLVKGNDKLFLKKQNAKYLKEYSKFGDNELSYTSQNTISFKFVKVKLVDKENVKVNLITYLGSKKVDSIQFYRNISGNEFGTYNCLSYFDKKTNKIWQIKYFPSNPIRGNSVGIVSYKKSSITSDGTIKSDSLYYLDESLDVEMDKYNLYY
ncbi:hypothetical protein [Chryseobacterium sp. c4a]|uniref:hypothetical protein n=1 Tax=Chryseobacterium sp. c4a TaxID=1573582 RepID=UPI00135AEF5C|nr:hypothetical protein [Chryseobacterium sp. c4a]